MLRRQRTSRPSRLDEQPASRGATIHHSRRWGQTEHPYAGLTAVLATKHDKLPLIAPPLETAVGLGVAAVAVDTDVLGTFTGEIPRQGSALDTAIAKARLGMDATGRLLGLASEGTIGPDPTVPFVHSDREIVVLVDDEHEIIVWESAVSWDIVARSTTVRPEDDLGPFLDDARFPGHHLIVRPNCGTLHPIHKGISTPDHLSAAVAECAANSADGLARVESDLRAHACPSRRPVIAAAAERLAGRIASRCPACGAPGWGRVDVLVGVPCAWCGTDVPRPRAEIDGCVACGHRETRFLVSAEDRASPGECPSCNP